MGTGTLSPNESIKRQPISPAEFFERIPGLGATAVAGLKDDTPMSLPELARTGLGANRPRFGRNGGHKSNLPKTQLDAICLRARRHGNSMFGLETLFPRSW